MPENLAPRHFRVIGGSPALRKSTRMTENSNFETATRMQASVTEALDLPNETQETRKLYGLDNRRRASTARAGCSPDCCSDGA